MVLMGRGPDEMSGGSQEACSLIFPWCGTRPKDAPVPLRVRIQLQSDLGAPKHLKCLSLCLYQEVVHGGGHGFVRQAS